jgi:hypothetical protein
MQPPPQISIWTILFLLACVAPFVGLAIAVAISPLRKRPVPWYHDDQADQMRRLGIDPNERWKTTEY